MSGRRVSDQAGLTLIELLITIVIMGIAFSGIIGGLGLAVLGSDQHRKQADTDNILRSFAEAVKPTYQDCAPAAHYDDDAIFKAPPGYDATVTAVAFSPPPFDAYFDSCRGYLLQPTAATRPTAFRDPSNALVIGESPTPLTADATLPTVGTDPDNATLTLDGYESLRQFIPEVPLKKVSLRVAHRESQGVDAVNITMHRGDGVNVPLTLAPSTGSIADDRIDVTSSFATRDQLNNLSVTYTAHRAPTAATATDSLDGIWVEIQLAGDPPRDAGLQRVDLRVRSNNGRAEQDLQVVVRRP